MIGSDQAVRWEVLSSKPCMRALGLLVRSSDPLHERLIARKLRMRGGHLHRTLRRLVDVGFVKRDEAKHKVFYSATEVGREALKEHEAISALQKFGLPKVLEELEAKLEEIKEKYPDREGLSDLDRHIFAREVMLASGEVLVKCFTKEFTGYAMKKLPKYMGLMQEAHQILHSTWQTPGLKACET